MRGGETSGRGGGGRFRPRRALCSGTARLACQPEPQPLARPAVRPAVARPRARARAFPFLPCPHDWPARPHTTTTTTRRAPLLPAPRACAVAPRVRSPTTKLAALAARSRLCRTAPGALGGGGHRLRLPLTPLRPSLALRRRGGLLGGELFA